MDRERVLTILREHEPELRATGIAHLSLFGSVARGEQTRKSDIDLLADFTGDAQMSLLRLCHIQNQISDWLGEDVDLIPARSLRSFARDNADQEAVLAF